ncbi:MAG: hypothetical protein WC479_08540 [Candidatus Izemoplasmatales bacterium]|jgi:hypothetical protein
MIDLILKLGIAYYAAKSGDAGTMFFVGVLIFMDANGKFDLFRKMGQRAGSFVSKKLGLTK